MLHNIQTFKLTNARAISKTKHLVEAFLPYDKSKCLQLVISYKHPVHYYYVYYHVSPKPTH